MDCFEEVLLSMHHVDEEVCCGIHPRTVLHSDVFYHEWRRQFVKGLIRSWVNALEERCVKEGGKER